MAEIINLRMARKAKDRAAKAAEADASRAQHGRNKSERTATKLDQARTARLLDGAKRETPED
jgi:hypothetical protein